MNQIELILAPLVFTALLFGSWSGVKLAMFFLISATVLFQKFWLMPPLFAQARLVTEGRPTEPSYHHWLYIILEATKVMMLFAFGIVASLGCCT